MAQQLATPDAPTRSAVVQRLANGLVDVTPTGRFIAITQHNAKVSPLLQLPPELRNRIWHYALTGHTIKPLSPAQAVSSQEQDEDYSKTRPGNHRFSLLRVSRQIYTESAVLPCTLATFIFFLLSDITAWTFQKPELARNVRHLKFALSAHAVLEGGAFPLPRSLFPSLETVDARVLYSNYWMAKANVNVESLGWVKERACDWMKGLEADLHVECSTIEEWRDDWTKT